MSKSNDPDDPTDVPEPRLRIKVPVKTIPFDPSDADTAQPVGRRTGGPDPHAFDDLSYTPAVPGPFAMGHDDVPEPAEDPRELAKRLAAEAMQKAKAKAAEDPRELAKRLAAEAMQKAKAKAAEDPRELAKRLAAEAKKKAQGKAPPPPAPVLPPAEPVSMAARAGRAPQRKRSAAEILAEARQEAASATAEPAPVATPAPPPAPSASAPSTGAAPTDVAARIASLAPGSRALSAKTPGNPVALKAVWQAHLARAQATGDLDLAVAASALLHHLAQHGAPGVVAVHLHHNDQEHVVWADAASGTPIAAVSPASIYLAGV